MNTNRRFGKFLATFNDGTTVSTTAPATPPPAATNVAPTVVPVEALPAIIDLAVRRQNSQQQLQQVQQQTNQQAQQAAPAADTNSEDLAKRVAELTRQVAASNKRAEEAALETYRMQAIQSWRSQGVELIEGMVFGRNKAEIDASLNVAAAEYAHLQSEWAKKQALVAQALAPAVAAAPPALVPPPVPQGIVTQQQAPGTQVAETQQTQQPVGLPGFVSAPNVQEQQQGLDPAMLQAMTSSDAVRNGSYAANRNQLLAALRSGNSLPQGQWGFNQGQQLAPSVPRASSPQHAPAMVPNAYAGVQIPQVRPQQGILGPPMQPSMNGYGPNYNASPVQRQAPTPQGFGVAPQPEQLDQGQAQLDNNSVSAAHTAAQASIQVARAKAANMRPTH